MGACAPDPEEIKPNPKKGEFLVFLAHLDRGLGLPVSPFFLEFLRLYGLQPHHLGANCFTQLSCFVTLFEAYLGVWPCMEVVGMFFFLRAQTTIEKLQDCGSVSIYTKSTPLPKIQLPNSIKKWQSSYFYVENLTDIDHIGLPAFADALPAHKSWNRKPLVDPALEEILMGRLKELVEAGLTSREPWAPFGWDHVGCGRPLLPWRAAPTGASPFG